MSAPRQGGHDLYAALGVEPIINCKGTFTIIGGSMMPLQVLEAMSLASQCFVQLDELAEAVGRRLALMTGAEAAVVTSGAAAAIKLATLACLSEGDPERLLRLPVNSGPRNQVIVPASSRNIYDHAIRSAGAEIVPVDDMSALQAALGDRTAMVYVLSTAFDTDRTFALPAIADVARQHHVSVFVDAAAEGLVVPNPHLAAGANLVAYSGGKVMRGPQSTGFLLGDAGPVRAVSRASAPHHGPGRDVKVSREEQVGLLTAIGLWLARDAAADEEHQMRQVQYIARRLSGMDGLLCAIEPPSGLANRAARLVVRWKVEQGRVDGKGVLDFLAATRPRIALSVSSTDPGHAELVIVASMMEPGQEELVAARLVEALAQPVKGSTEGAAVPLTGLWDVELEFGAGTGRHTLALTSQSGATVEGLHLSALSSQPVRGTATREAVQLESVSHCDAFTVTYIFDGRADGDIMAGVVHMGEYGRAPFTAHRRPHRAGEARILIPQNGCRTGGSW